VRVGELPLVYRGGVAITPAAFAASFRRNFTDLVGKPLLVALSGGADSVALLCLLHESAPEIGCPVRAAHVHHHLRGAEADGDAEYCGDLCERLAVPFVIEHMDPVRPRGVSPEAWCRRERYLLLEAARRRLECDALATAHTRDDQAETVLLKLLRGSGPRGVAGVRRRCGVTVRPILDFGRRELREFLTGRGVTWREDATNADPRLPRAWVRSRLMPLLSDTFPGSVGHLSDFARALGEDEALLGAILAEHATWPELGAAFPAARVAALPPPLQRRWVLELASRLSLAEPPSRRQLEAVADMVTGGSPAAVDLGRRWVLRRRGESLVLCPPPVRPFEAHAARVPSRVELPGGFVASVGVSGRRAHHRARLDPRLAGCDLAWRSITPDERFGSGGGRRVSRLLAGAGVPREWRRAWPVLDTGGRIVWLPAVGVAEGWAGDATDGVVAELEEPWERHVR
jgi:tRNA(Ile)-lysidine synthase